MLLSRKKLADKGNKNVCDNYQFFSYWIQYIFDFFQFNGNHDFAINLPIWRKTKHDLMKKLIIHENVRVAYIPLLKQKYLKYLFIFYNWDTLLSLLILIL